MSVLLLSVTEGEGYGSEVVLRHLLIGLERMRYPITVAAPAGSGILAFCRETDVPWVALHLKDNLVSSLREVHARASSLPRVQVVHGWTARTFELARYLAWRMGARATCTLHDHPRAPFHRVRRHWLMRLAASRMDKVVCVSHAVAEACGGWGYQRELLLVIHNGLQDRCVSRTPAEGVRIGFLGMHAPLKGYALIAPWIAALCREIPDVRWRLYGECAAQLLPAARALAAEFPQRVELCGRRPPEEIFAGIDILLHASTMFDSLPTVLIEAAMNGVPVVASSRGGAREIVEDGVSGYLFDPAEPHQGMRCLRALATDAALRQRMGAAARALFVAHFEVERMASAYVALWKAAGAKA